MLRSLEPCGRDVINFSSSSVVNFCELLVSFVGVAHSSRGLGHLPLKEEITGSNPVCATKEMRGIDFKSVPLFLSGCSREEFWHSRGIM